MRKVVIIINGKGGVGKDTLCTLASCYYHVMNVSSITPIKDIARQLGWGGEKNEKSRKFLSDLKNTVIEYNDFITLYLYTEYRRFLTSTRYQIMFVHIREISEIEKFKKSIGTPCITLLVRRELPIEEWGNKSDDEVENYDYDYIYDNNKSLEELEDDFRVFFDKMISEVGADINWY